METLVDKGTHGQSLKDLESMTLWFSIAATPLHFASTAASGMLTRGAVQQGRIFSQSTRAFATALLCTTFGLDTALISIGLANLVKKGKDNDLTTLDVVQFSLSVFFFTNTLIQPKTANGVIRKAQSAHFDQVGNSMADETSKKAFDKFLENNKVDGSIQERSNIVRTVNRMDDPNKFFGAVGSESSVQGMEIGGRKGRTVLLKSSDGSSHRVRPNDYQVNKSDSASSATSNQVAAAISSKQTKTGKQEQKYSETNSSAAGPNAGKVSYDLKNAQTDFQKHGKAVVAAASGILQAAHTVAARMGYKNKKDFLNILELLAKEVKS